jgi:hypothetical protein
MFDVFYSGPKPNLFEHEQPADSLEDAAAKSRTRLYWYIYGGNDYTNFDFGVVPPPWEETQIYVYPSQHSRNGSVYLANKDTVQNKEWNFRKEQRVRRLVDQSKWTIPDNINDTGFDYSWHPDEIEPAYEYHFPTTWQRQGGPVYRGTAGVKFVDGREVVANATQIFYMDFMNVQSAATLDVIRAKYPDTKSTRYVDNHLNVFKRIMNLATTEYVWIVSSICDYIEFDFNWHPPEEQREMIHVFPSRSSLTIMSSQRRGDTFYIHVPSFRQQLYELELLDWFNVINYCDDQTVRRYSAPIVSFKQDTVVDAVRDYQFEFPYAVFKHETESAYIYEPPCLWSEKDRAVEAMNSMGSVTLVPRDAKAYVKTQIYDYPYVAPKRDVHHPVRQNIIFISYDEPQADANWSRLIKRFPFAQRCHGVQGMQNALLRAAEMSITPWYYAVFAKTEIADDFKFDFRPDYYQLPKHYIFHARNTLNGLEYGHMGIVLYNCNIVKNTQDFGIDYTMSAPHVVVPELSAIASFNSTPYQTWRTAFREAAKLAQFCDEQANIENEYRLEVWLSKAEGLYSEWCLQGARDGYEFYQTNKRMPANLKQAFSWTWLQQYFESIYTTFNEPNLDVLAQRQESWQLPAHY